MYIRHTSFPFTYICKINESNRCLAKKTIILSHIYVFIDITEYLLLPILPSDPTTFSCPLVSCSLKLDSSFPPTIEYEVMTASLPEGSFAGSRSNRLPIIAPSEKDKVACGGSK